MDNKQDQVRMEPGSGSRKGSRARNGVRCRWMNRQTDGSQGDRIHSRESKGPRVVGGRVLDVHTLGVLVGVVAGHTVLGFPCFMGPK